MNEPQPIANVNLEALTDDGVDAIVKQLGAVDEEEAAIIRRTTHRLAEIGVQAIGADSGTMAQLQIERNALISTLLSLLDARGVDAQHKIESFVTGVLYKAIDVVLGRLGL